MMAEVQVRVLVDVSSGTAGHGCMGRCCGEFAGPSVDQDTEQRPSLPLSLSLEGYELYNRGYWHECYSKSISSVDIHFNALSTAELS